jgi:hypothetical protein
MRREVCSLCIQEELDQVVETKVHASFRGNAQSAPPH